MNIQMVDLKTQYNKIKNELDASIINVVQSSNFINGPEVSIFRKNLSSFLGGCFVIPCANGTDALQIALMALDLEPGDEVIVPSFTYAATAEVICLLKLTPVLVDVDPFSFNISIENIIKAISDKTKVIIPVHLFGQCAEMDVLINIAKKFNLFIIEDAAQALGATIKINNKILKAGTVGHIGCTSFFPTKNLGCYGDGGAIMTQNEELAKKIEMICNHGQISKYNHKLIGVNSRLDTIQAAVLNIKLNYFENYNIRRINSANVYDNLLQNIKEIVIPKRCEKTTHVFHQYTLKVKNGLRDELKEFLEKNGIPSMIYYPIPLHKQEAFKKLTKLIGNQDVSEKLCKEVLSIPMHTELEIKQQEFIANCISNFFNK